MLNNKSKNVTDLNQCEYIPGEKDSINHICYIDETNPDLFLCSSTNHLYLVQNYENKIKKLIKFNLHTENLNNNETKNVIPRYFDKNRKVLVQYNHCNISFMDPVSIHSTIFLPHTDQVQWFREHTLAYNNGPDLLVYDINKQSPNLKGHVSVSKNEVSLLTDHEHCIYTAVTNSVYRWDTRIQQEKKQEIQQKIKIETLHKLYTSSLQLSKNNHYLIAGGHNGITITDLRVNKPSYFLSLSNKFVKHIVFNSSETYMAATYVNKLTGQSGCLIIEMDFLIEFQKSKSHVPTREPLHEKFFIECDDITCVAFEPTDKRLCLGRKKGTLSFVHSPDWQYVAKDLLDYSSLFHHPLGERKLISNIVDSFK